MTDSSQLDLDTALQPVSREETLRRMKYLIVHITISLAKGEDPTTALGFSPLLSFGEASFARRGCAGTRELASIMRILSTCYEVVLANKTISQREIYYINATYFRDQREFQTSLEKLMNLLQVPRHALGILAASRGWVAGLLCMEDDADSTTTAKAGTSTSSKKAADNEWVASVDAAGVSEANEWCLHEDTAAARTSTMLHLRAGQPKPIPANAVAKSISVINDGAKCILVVEKECIFRRLVEDKVWDRFPCIIITGCGFPDMATRAFLWQMHEQLHLPILALCDYNPFGIGIMLCYRGHSRSVLAADAHEIPVQWMGIKASDITLFGISDAKKQPLTKTDLKKVSSLLREPAVINDPEIHAEVESFLSGRFKVEIEAIMSSSLTYLTDVYFPTKLHELQCGGESAAFGFDEDDDGFFHAAAGEEEEDYAEYDDVVVDEYD